MTDESNHSNHSIFGALHPEIRHGKNSAIAEKRNIIASVFIAMIIGIAYSEMFPPIRESVRSNGITAGTLLLGLTFFFVSMRFFIGNQLHLLSESIVCMRGDMWLYDFLVITLETLVLCFLGGLSSVDLNRQVSIDFVDLLVALYALDIVWIFSQWFLGVVHKAWRRETVPWAWAIVNAVLIGALVLVQLKSDDVYSTVGLTILFSVNTLAFAMDIFLIDWYDVI